MKLQKTTLVLLLLALGLGVFVYFHEIRGTAQREDLKAKNQQLFPFTVDDVQAFTLKRSDLTLTVERNRKSGSSKWLIKSPEVAPASDASVSYLLQLIAPGKSDRMITVPSNQLSEYGFTPPQATIDIQVQNRQTHQLIIGKPDFNRRFLYAQVKPSPLRTGNTNLHLVSVDLENALKRQLSEWKQPVETQSPATPLPNPTATPAATPQPTPTPTSTATPAATPQPTPTSTPTATPAATPQPTPTSTVKPNLEDTVPPVYGPTIPPNFKKTSE